MSYEKWLYSYLTKLSTNIILDANFHCKTTYVGLKDAHRSLNELDIFKYTYSGPS